ncbi:hypothetical protein B0H14DRAFT_2618962 [Mycena olivaceomarginata]|nr:hypothetical protein B0H14DRAFT_2618962 [Mycena olivaceomarginata]
MAPLCAALPSAVLGGLTDPIIAACCARPSKLEAGDCGRRLLEHTIAPDPRQRHCYSTRRSLSPPGESMCPLFPSVSAHLRPPLPHLPLHLHLPSLSVETPSAPCTVLCTSLYLPAPPAAALNSAPPTPPPALALLVRHNHKHGPDSGLRWVQVRSPRILCAHATGRSEMYQRGCMRVRAYPGAEVVAEVPREVQAKDARSSSRPTASGARPHCLNGARGAGGEARRKPRPVDLPDSGNTGVTRGGEVAAEVRARGGPAAGGAGGSAGWRVTASLRRRVQGYGPYGLPIVIWLWVGESAWTERVGRKGVLLWPSGSQSSLESHTTM